MQKKISDIASDKPHKKKAKRKSSANQVQTKRHLAIPAGLKNVCVYCGSGSGTNPAYARTARHLGNDLANADIGLVYGGGGLGLMGEVARATIKSGGRVTGIIPTFLSELEQMLKEVDELIITDNMHERKQLMFEKSDAFVALPGGIGTLEELVEQLTWSQLGQHAKPVVIANINDYWSPFLELIAHMKSQEFIREGLDVHFRIVNNPDEILPAIIKAHKDAVAEAKRSPQTSNKSTVIAKF